MRPSVARELVAFYTRLVTSMKSSLDALVAVDRAVERLHDAAARGVPCAPVRDLFDRTDVSTAYQIQARLVAGRVAAGARVVGRKIGLTNPDVQAQLGVDRPDFGVLLDDMACEPDAPVAIERLLQPKIEAEVAFVLSRDLDGDAPICEDDVARATDHVRAALEIVDSRIAGWDISIADTVADNASSGLFVLGAERVRLTELDLAGVTMTLRSGDELVSSGTGADCLGSPLTAVAWLAATARDLGTPLRAGEVVLSGALGPMTPVTGGSRFSADISGIGTVSIQFTTGGRT